MENPFGSESKVTKLGNTIKNAVGKRWRAYHEYVVGPTIPLKEINEQRVAKTITHDIWAERTRLGDKSNQPISTSTVLFHLGYATGSGDYFKRFPREYQKVQLVLRELEKNGCLEQLPPANTPNYNKESIFYRVSNKEGLKELAANPQTGLPAKP